MSDQRGVVAALAAAAARGERTVLASVVRVVGAAYRGVGARMLVGQDGRTVGMVSAGCLEADLVAHAGRVRTSDAATLVTYDNTAGEEVVWGLGLGCDGTVEVLLEPLAPARAAALAALLGRALASDGPAPLATVVRSAGEGAPAIGARVLATASAPGSGAAGGFACEGDWGDGAVLARLRTELTVAPPGVHEIGDTQLVVERVVPPVRLVVCGSGPDAVPVVRLAAALDWEVTVVAPTAGRADRFPGARLAECDDAAGIADVVALGARTAAVVMSHDYARDRAYLGALLDAAVGYVGVMGPRRRTERMLADLDAVGRSWPDERLAQLYAPVGLDVGGDGPEAIALAIVAEVSAVAAGREGGHLRARRAPIHADVPTVDVPTGG